MVVPNIDPPAPRRAFNAVVLALGLLCATLGYAALLIRSLVIDSSTTVRAATAALHDDDVRSMVVARTSDALSAQLVGEVTVRDLAAFGIDVRRDLGPVAAALVRTPEFEAAFGAAVQQLHDRVFADPTLSPTIDVTALVERARTEAAAINPAYRQLIAGDATLSIELPSAALPDFSSLDNSMSAPRTMIALALGALLVLAAVLRAHERWRPFRAGAVWLLALGGTQLALCVAAHVALARLSGDTAPILRATGTTVLPAVAAPALVPLVLGVLALLVSLQMRQADTRRLAANGRAAFVTDEHGRPTEWTFDAAFEPEILRTAPGTAIYQR